MYAIYNIVLSVELNRFSTPSPASSLYITIDNSNFVINAYLTKPPIYIEPPMQNLSPNAVAFTSVIFIDSPVRHLASVWRYECEHLES